MLNEYIQSRVESAQKLGKELYKAEQVKTLLTTVLDSVDYAFELATDLDPEIAEYIYRTVYSALQKYKSPSATETEPVVDRLYLAVTNLPTPPIDLIQTVVNPYTSTSSEIEPELETEPEPKAIEVINQTVEVIEITADTNVDDAQPKKRKRRTKAEIQLDLEAKSNQTTKIDIIPALVANDDAEQVITEREPVINEDIINPAPTEINLDGIKDWWCEQLSQPNLSEFGLSDIQESIKKYCNDKAIAVPNDIAWKIDDRWELLNAGAIEADTDLDNSSDETEPSPQPLTLVASELVIEEVYQGYVPDDDVLNHVSNDESDKVPTISGLDSDLIDSWLERASKVEFQSELDLIWSEIRSSGIIPTMPLIRNLETVKHSLLLESVDELNSEPTLETVIESKPKPSFWSAPVITSVTEIAVDDTFDVNLTDDDALESGVTIPDVSEDSAITEQEILEARASILAEPLQSDQSMATIQPSLDKPVTAKPSFLSAKVTRSSASVATDLSESVPEDEAKSFMHMAAVRSKNQPVRFKCGSSITPHNDRYILEPGTYVKHFGSGMLGRVVTWDEAEQNNPRVKSSFDRIPVQSADPQLASWCSSHAPESLCILTEEEAIKLQEQERAELLVLANSSDPFA